MKPAPAGATPTGPRPSSSNRLPTIRNLVLAGSVLVATTAIAACGSSLHGSAVLGTKVEQQCTQVADVLSDGPDPDADTVGYAEAQVLPLKQLTISDPALKTAVANLDAAYQAYISSNGPAQNQTATKTTQAENALNAICPGAAP
jgi:hypothetical protein